MQVFAIIIAAYRVELLSALITFTIIGATNDRDLPLGIYLFSDNDDDIFGDHICNNAAASAVISILVAMMLMIIDLHIPCINKTVCGSCW